jgi:hypothetical protein
MNKMVDNILAQFEYNKSKRVNWESYWSKVSDYFIPTFSGDWSLDGAINDTSVGEKKGEKIHNSQPVLALSRFVGIADGLLTPVDKKWHTLKPRNPELLEDKDVKDWFYNVNQLLFDYRYNPGSNFAEQNNMRWEQMGAFGTGLLFIDSDKKNTIRYKCINLKTVTLGQNHQGIINRVDRVLHLSLLDIIDSFGKKNIPEKLLQSLDNVESANKKLKVLHSVMPSKDKDKDEFDSYYILIEDKVILSQGKFDTFPYSISRYNTAPDEVFGRGLAMQCIDDVINLNGFSEDVSLAIEKAVRPTILTKDDSMAVNGLIDMAPNNVISGGLDFSGNPTIRPFNDGARVDLGAAQIDKLEARINETFLITLFQIMVDTPRMTATEALIRAQEKSMLLTPLLVRQQNQALSPLVVRELSILKKKGLLPDFPEGVDNVYDIAFESPVNKMQDSEELVNLNKVIQTLLPLVQNDPDAFNIIDMNKLTKMALDAANIPSIVLKSDEQVAKESEAKAQQQQEQGAQEAALNVSQIIKNTGMDGTNV